jgi:hypothetical protein
MYWQMPLVILPPRLGILDISRWIQIYPDTVPSGYRYIRIYPGCIRIKDWRNRANSHITIVLRNAPFPILTSHFQNGNFTMIIWQNDMLFYFFFYHLQIHILWIIFGLPIVSLGTAMPYLFMAFGQPYGHFRRSRPQVGHPVAVLPPPCKPHAIWHT